MSRYGLTVDEALPKIIELVRLRPVDDVLRAELRGILNQVHSLAYRDGGDDERYAGWGTSPDKPGY